MNSTDLIGEAKKRFDELQGDSSFEESLSIIINNWVESWLPEYTSKVITNLGSEFEIDCPFNFEYQLQQIKELHWRSFYIGWLEGRIDLLNK